MIRHLLRITWNRRRANVLIAVEVFLAFLVVTVIATIGVFLLDNYAQPLGFDCHDVWAVHVDMHALEIEVSRSDQVPYAHTPAGQRARVATLVRLVGDLSEVLDVSAATHAPYDAGSWSSAVTVNGRRHDFGAIEADDAFADVMRIRMTRGRWFGAADEGSGWQSTVINERLSLELFGGVDPVGRVVHEDPPKNGGRGPSPPMRIVGVISDFRRDGELEPPANCAFFRHNLDGGLISSRVPTWLFVRVRPGTAPSFEERLVRTLQAGERDWSFRARPLESMRAAVLREYLPALSTCAFIASFLLVMVALGLTGVLWQAVTQRRRELGVRRAVGATAAAVGCQVLGEVLVISSFGVGVGAVVAAQFPLLQLLGPVRPGVYAIAFVVSVACIYGLALFGAWMPARMASSVEPAEALRYE